MNVNYVCTINKHPCLWCGLTCTLTPLSFDVANVVNKKYSFRQSMFNVLQMHIYLYSMFFSLLLFFMSLLGLQDKMFKAALELGRCADTYNTIASYQPHFCDKMATLFVTL